MSRTVGNELHNVASAVEKRFLEGRRVLSFGEYLDMFAQDPVRHSRDASRYVRDCFDHYGTRKVTTAWGEYTRFALFDLPWEPEPAPPPSVRGPTPTSVPGAAPRMRRGALVGQEQVQEELYRVLSNFAREGKPNRLVLLHGPNGSAKSTFVACLMRALEHYSTLDQGALYRYSWVFPSSKTVRGALGFGQEKGQTDKLTSYAHLPDDQIDAKLLLEVRDHPLFLIPVDERRALLDRMLPKGAEPPPEWIVRGEQSHKSQQVFEALLSSYKGSYSEVLKHVQVERYFVSQRYRVGAVTVGPQMSVDAAERQVTADRSLSALPPSLQAVSLYEAKGELVDAAGGLLEFSDLLKRPLDTFKYLREGKRAERYLRELRPESDFVWVHILPPHAPYVLRDPLLARLDEIPPDLPPRVSPLDLEPYYDPAVTLPAERERAYRAMYKLNAAYADQLLARMLAALRASGQYDRSLIVVTSDHGEEFGEYGQIAHGGNLGHALVQVPLVIKLPAGYPKRLQIPAGHAVSNLRVAATLIEAAGGQPEPGMAKSFFQPLDQHDRGALSELYLGNGVNRFSLVDGDLQVQWESRFSPPDPQYYRARLAGVGGRPVPPLAEPPAAVFKRLHDAFARVPPLTGLPGEAPKLSLWRWTPRGTEPVEDPPLLQRMARQLRNAWLAANGAEVVPGLSGEQPRLTKEQEEELKALGYIAGGN